MTRDVNRMYCQPANYTLVPRYQVFDERCIVCGHLAEGQGDAE